MNRIEPYYADDTNGVIFEVCVDGVLVQAHVGLQLLSARYGAPALHEDWADVYLDHQHEIDQAVAICARAHGPETVILGTNDFR